MPAPADIVNIIDPAEPSPDWAAYVGIKEKIKQGGYVMDSDREYLAWCEGKAKAKPLEWKEQISALEQRMANVG